MNWKTKAFVAGSLALLGVVCLWGAGQTASLSAEESPLPENPLDGRFVFEQKGCMACHAINGDGGAVGPDLGQRKFYGTFQELAAVMWNHSPGMLRRMRELELPFPQFTSREMRELIAYLYYLRYLGEPGNLYRGKILARDKGCLDCHSVGGKGGRLAPPFDQLAKYASPLYMAQALWNHGPAMGEEIRKRGLKRPTFEKGEIVDLNAYVRSAARNPQRQQVYLFPGNPRRGSTTVSEKRCLVCHSVHGKGGSLAPDFAQLRLNASVTEIAGLMWNHGAAMQELMAKKGMSWPTLSAREMGDLISFLYFLGFEDAAGDPAVGTTIFERKGCSYCHGEEGRKSGLAPDLAKTGGLAIPSDMPAVMWNHAPAMEGKVAERVIQFPVMSGREMNDLFAFLKTKSGDRRRSTP